MSQINNYLHSIAPKDPVKTAGRLIKNDILWTLGGGALVGLMAGGAALNYYLRRRRTKNGKIVIEKVRR